MILEEMLNVVSLTEKKENIRWKLIDSLSSRYRFYGSLDNECLFCSHY